MHDLLVTVGHDRGIHTIGLQSHDISLHLLYFGFVVFFLLILIPKSPQPGLEIDATLTFSELSCQVQMILRKT